MKLISFKADSFSFPSSLTLKPTIPVYPRGFRQVTDIPVHPPAHTPLSLSFCFLSGPILVRLSSMHWKASLIKCSELWGTLAPFNYFCFMHPPGIYIHLLCLDNVLPSPGLSVYVCISVRAHAGCR